ncbi:MAG: hypothetical protein ACP5IT_12395, partial [Thermoproteota archaeon]
MFKDASLKEIWAIIILLFFVLPSLVQIDAIATESGSWSISPQSINIDVFKKVSSIEINLNLTKSNQNVNKMDISIVLPKGLKPQLLNEKVVQARFNDQLIDSTSYDEEKRNITWVIEIEKVLNMHPIRMKFNVSVTKELQARTNITINIKWSNGTKWFGPEKHNITINILRADLQEKELFFKDGNLTIKLMNSGNGSIIISNLNISLSSPILNISRILVTFPDSSNDIELKPKFVKGRVVGNFIGTHELYSESSLTIVFYDISISNLSNLNRTNPVSITVKVNNERPLNFICHFDINITMERPIYSPGKGINQTFEAKIKIVGNESLKLLLNDQNSMKIKFLPNDFIIIHEISYIINNQNEKEMGKKNNLFVISDSNITIPSSITIKISGLISKSYAENSPEVTLQVNLSNFVYTNSYTKTTILTSKKVSITVTPLILYCSVVLEGKEKENGTLELRIGDNKHNVNVINNAGNTILLKEVFWPISSLKVEVGNFTTRSENIVYYTIVDKPLMIYAGFLSVFVLATVIVTSAI